MDLITGKSDVVLGAQAALIAHAINTLNTNMTCCPHGCAPCEALAVMHDLGILSAAVKPYVDLSGEWDWWDGEKGEVRWDWVTEHWCDPVTCDYLLVEDDMNEEGHDGG